MISAGVASTAALAGCSGDNSSGDGSANNANSESSSLANEFEFMHQETSDARINTIGNLAERFTSEVDIGGINQRPVNEADLPAEISSDLAAGTLPAGAELPLRALHDASDALRPESATEVISAIGEDNFQSNLLELVSTPDGGYYSVPIYAWPQLTQYRPSKFEEMGLPMPDSWENILEAAEALHDPDNDQFGIIVGSRRDQFTLQCFSAFALANEARVFNADGEIIFDNDAMVESLEYYAELNQYTPTGAQNYDPIKPLWENGQLHMASNSSFSLSDVLDIEVSWTGSISKEVEATFGECMSTTTFDIDDQAQVRANEEWQKFLRGGDSYSVANYTDWCHMEPGGFQPVLTDFANRDDYQDNEVIQAWSDELVNEQLPSAISSIDRFGFVDGKVFTEIGDITGSFLITDAIRDVIDGADARATAESYADEMRETIE